MLPDMEKNQKQVNTYLDRYSYLPTYLTWVPSRYFEQKPPSSIVLAHAHAIATYLICVSDIYQPPLIDIKPTDTYPTQPSDAANHPRLDTPPPLSLPTP